MKYVSKTTYFFLFAAFGSTSLGMTRVLTKARPYGQLSSQQHIMQARALSTTAQTTPSIYTRIKQAIQNAWTQLTNRRSKTPTIVIPQSVVLQEPLAEPLTASVQIIPSTPTSMDQANISITTQLQRAQSLPEIEHILKNNEKIEQNKQQKFLNISNEQWLAMLKKQETQFVWIKNNCFKNKNGISNNRPKIPKERYALIVQCFKTVDIDPLSVNLVWEKITTPDMFGHKAIVTYGPIVNNTTTDLEQAPTITFDPDKVSALSPEEFEAELYHALTHLIQGDHNKLHLLKNAIGTEKYNVYTQSSEGEKYLAALEEKANFLLPVNDTHVATIVKEAVIQKDFNVLLNTIENKLNKETLYTQSEEPLLSELKIDTQKIADEYSTQCPNPKDEIRHLLRVKQLSTFEKYIKSKKRSVLTKMGFTKEEINTIEYIIDSNIAQFREQYKQAKEYNDHDQAIPTDQLDIAKQLLKEFGLESSSIPIRSIPNVSNAPLGRLSLEPLPNINLELFMHKTSKTSSYNLSSFAQQVLHLKPSDNPWDDKVFTIAHEIGHLLKGHTIEWFVVTQFFKNNVIPRAEIKYTTEHQKSKYIKKFTLLFHKELISLNELEADIWVAAQSKEIAKIAYKATTNDILIGAISSDIYLTTEERLYILTKIIQLHEKEALTNKSLADTTKE